MAMVEHDAPLPDGRYDVLVFDVDDPVTAPAADNGAGARAIGVEVVVTAGQAKGETIRIGLDPADGSATDPVDPIDLLGLPGHLTIDQGRPRLTLDS